MAGGWHLAIDLGHSTTCAAMRQDSDAAPIRVRLPLSVASSHDQFLMPSVVRISAGGVWEVGLAATQGPDGLGDPAIEWNVKQLIAEHAVHHPARPPAIETASLAAALLRPVIETACQANGGSVPRTVTLTHPVTWDEAAVRRLCAGAVEAAAAGGYADFPRPMTLSEPVAAAGSVLAATDLGERLADGDLLAVLDLGGGTLDLALVEHFAGQLYALKTTGAQTGGDDCDRELRAIVAARIEPGAWAILEQDDRSGRTASRLLNDEIIRMKHRLTSHQNGLLEVRVGPETVAATISISRREFEAALCARSATGRPTPVFAQIVDLLSELCGQAGREVKAVVFTGGGSQVPALRDAAESRGFANIYTARTHCYDAKQTVAHGALIPDLLADLSLPELIGILCPDDLQVMADRPAANSYLTAKKDWRTLRGWFRTSTHRYRTHWTQEKIQLNLRRAQIFYDPRYRDDQTSFRTPGRRWIVFNPPKGVDGVRDDAPPAMAAAWLFEALGAARAEVTQETVRSQPATTGDPQLDAFLAYLARQRSPQPTVGDLIARGRSSGIHHTLNRLVRRGRATKRRRTGVIGRLIDDFPSEQLQFNLSPNSFRVWREFVHHDVVMDPRLREQLVRRIAERLRSGHTSPRFAEICCLISLSGRVRAYWPEHTAEIEAQAHKHPLHSLLQKAAALVPGTEEIW
ncbi:Hsp70 family protein [Dactylosporangium sp. NPDC049525]|uniref:Hsp70 family protein n=1 Tax=Dactylosporangium sp. NPDC049525 TaxID=3154730 RepID=UPI0034253513